MAMTPFYTGFRDLAFREMRSATVRDWQDLPDGEYGFLELYCDEPHCDCRRVLIQVIVRDDLSQPWATINYGWESVAFYYRRLPGRELAEACARPTLDPLNPQSPYAPALLRLFETIVQDPAYVQRLQRHYALFKGQDQPAARIGAKLPARRRRHR
jgi:hypothetical protein